MQEQVLIVGAGACGLIAAHYLSEKKHRVTVIEARERTGGRIHALEDIFSVPVEAGAEFIHGTQPLTLSLLEESENDKILLSGNRYQLRNGQLEEGDFSDEQWEMVTKALEKVETDTDIATFLNEYFGSDDYTELRKKVRTFVEGFDAADVNRVSALALREEWAGNDHEHQYRISGGYSVLIRYLQEKINRNGGAFIFSDPVKEIRWSKGAVSVHTIRGRVVEGEKAVITVPLGALQNGSIKFTPALPHHAAAFRHIGFGGVIKVFVEFRHAFWEHRIGRPLKDVGFIFSDAAIPTWWSQLPDRTPLLTGWLGGPSAANVRHNDASLYEKSIASLRYIFNCQPAEITRELREFHVADWVQDPYTFGAYAYPTLQSRKAQAFLAEPVNDTVYFAGEALYSGSAMGTVEAALVSGKDVAEKIVRDS